MDRVGFLKKGRLAELGIALPAGAHRIGAADADCLARGEEIIAQAEARAARIVAEAQEVYESEKRRGHAEGDAEARAEVLQLILEDQVRLDRSLVELEAGIRDVALSVAKAIIGKTTDEEAAIAMTRNALKKVRREKRAELSVAPSVRAAIRQRLDEILSDFPEIELVDVIEDENLPPRKIVLESKVGRIDADVDSLLAAFDGLFGRLSRPGQSGEGEAS